MFVHIGDVEVFYYNGKNAKELVEVLPNAAVHGQKIIFHDSEGKKSVHPNQYIIKICNNYFLIMYAIDFEECFVGGDK